MEQHKQPRRSERALAHRPGSLPAIGLEAEFVTIVDGVPQQPEAVFGSPRNVVRGPLVHRVGRSYHLPTRGALYFDTGVMEIATPMIEIARGCGARGTRSLWENIAFLRAELDAWELTHGRTVSLTGFSAHYNVSFDVPASEQRANRTVEQLAYLLTHVLAMPVMLLAANRKSTGIGVRPRGNRVEITADFTPDAALMAATATLIVGVVRAVMRWPDYSVQQLHARGIPVVRGFAPLPHSSRKGWVAKHSCYPSNPFAADVDDRLWITHDGDARSLRDMARRTTRYFWHSIRTLGDPQSLRLISAVMRGRASSLLDLDHRPRAYDDVGRLCSLNDLFPDAELSRSRYERVIGHTVARRKLRIRGAWHEPVGVKGWSHVVLRRVRDGARVVRSLDEMLPHLAGWDRSLERRVSAVATSQRRRESDVEVAVPMASDVAGDVVVRADAAAVELAVPKPRTDARTQSPLVIVSRI
ncbi:MAG: hypothetical protein ABJE47_22455 [bacterium]